jgi:hypothetical protein
MKTLEQTNLILSPFKVGRPLFNGKDRDQVISKLEYAFSIDATVKEACIYAGISSAAYYRFLKQEPEYRERFAGLRALIGLAAKKTIVEAIFDGNIGICMWYAERRLPNEFNTSLVLKNMIKTLRAENESLEEELLKIDRGEQITSKDVFALLKHGHG